MEATSPYQALDPSLMQIRLLHLNPDPTNLSAVLETVSLNDKPRYTALSYTWGLELSGAGIALNGNARQPITRNLQVALEHLCADANEPMTLWVDALCINQDDDPEKSHQITLMTEVYSMAEVTCIWLGPAAEESDLAMAAINDLYAEKTYLLSNDALSDVQLRAINALLKRQWWYRIWVLQEVMLSPNPIVRCGNAKLPFEAFVHLEDNRRAYNRPEKRFHSHLRGAIAPLIHPNPFCKILIDYIDDKPKVAAGQTCLSEWLVVVGELQATNPRDKIYGLLGLVPREDVRFLAPDYSKSVADIYTSAMKQTINETQILFALQFNNENKNPKHALPSWCPDYSTESRGYIGIYSANASRSSCWDTTSLPVSSLFPTTGSGELHLPGVDFDVVQYVGPNPHMEKYKGDVAAERLAISIARNSQTRDNVIEWEKEVLARWEKDDCPYPPLGIGPAEAFWRTLVWDHGWFRDAITPDLAQYFLVWLGRADVDASHAAAEAAAGKDEVEARRTFVKPFTDFAVPRCDARSFIITEKGFIGMAPLQTRVGDMITVLQNGDVPFVLRQRPVASEEHNHSDVARPVKAAQVLVPCEFIGDAFVLGIMDGEAVARASKEDVKVFVLT